MGANMASLENFQFNAHFYISYIRREIQVLLKLANFTILGNIIFFPQHTRIIARRTFSCQASSSLKTITLD